MEAGHGSKKAQSILAALKMRMYLSLGFGYSRLFPARDALLIRADMNARRRVTFIQRLPSRVFILAVVALFFSFFIVENKAGFMIVMFLMPPIIIPISVLLGAFMATRVDSIDVCLRREYARLSTGFAADLPGPELVAPPKKDVAQRMCDYRANWYGEIRKILRQTKGTSLNR